MRAPLRQPKLPPPPPPRAAARCRLTLHHRPCRSELCTLLGGSITRTQAGQLLRRSGNSIAAAADLYFEDPAAAGPPGGTGGAAGAREAACHRGDSSDPITMSEDSEAETTEDR